jgi:tRNA uridine 5-carboxymethylaminomethyl modification enzyme
VNETEWRVFENKRNAIASEKKRLHETWVRPSTEKGKHIETLLAQPLQREYSLEELLRRPNVSYAGLMSIDTLGPGIDDPKAAEQVEIQIKYAGYIDRQQDEIARQLRHEETKIPATLNYMNVVGLSTEVQQKLSAVRPATVGMASRIPGVTPAAISLLLVHLKKSGTAHDKQYA